jgi:hypothetical protein
LDSCLEIRPIKMQLSFALRLIALENTNDNNSRKHGIQFATLN